ncbi:MAG: NUDIX domain-containing protein [Acidimicrobiales bacterium]
MTGFRLVSEREVHAGYIFSLTVATFEAPDGSTFERDIIRHPGAVAVVPVDGDEVILVRQYRAALDRDLLEIPAGLRDVQGEPVEVTAQRELAEEIGMRAGSLTLICNVHNTVGFCDEEIHIFVGTDLDPVERDWTDSPEEAVMEVVRMSIDDAVAAIDSGQITDAKTIIGVQALLRR